MSPLLLMLFSLCVAEEDVENFDVTNLSQDVLRSIEADSFWCMSKLLDGIQVSLCWGHGGFSPCAGVEAWSSLGARLSSVRVLALGGFCYFSKQNPWLKSWEKKMLRLWTRCCPGEGRPSRRMVLLLRSRGDLGLW